MSCIQPVTVYKGHFIRDTFWRVVDFLRKIKDRPKSIQLDRGSATNLPVLAKCYVIWAVRGQFWPLAQLVSSSKFKLVCQLVNAKKPKKSRVTHPQFKGVIEFYYKGSLDGSL